MQTLKELLTLVTTGDSSDRAWALFLALNALALLLIWLLR